MYELQIEKMSCGGCASRVRRAVLSLDDGATVEADIPGKRIRVRTDAGLGELRAALSAAGYPVTDARTLQDAGQ